MEEQNLISQPVSEDNLIVVMQLPVIKEQLKEIKKRFELEAENALSLECTEETLQTVKKARTNLSKIFSALETKRKEAKKQILAPYESFEAVYKECVTDIYKPCDSKLAEKIRETEDTLKERKRIAAEEYFTEYSASKGIDFLTFDRMGLNITLSASAKSIKDQIKAFVDRTCDELAMIEMQENSAEILVEYKSSLNAAQAVMLVANRHRAIEEERRRKEESAAIAEEKAQAAAKVEEVIDEAFTPPKAEVIEEEPQERTSEKIYQVSFTVYGSIDKIRDLKEFLTKGEYQYEQQ